MHLHLHFLVRPRELIQRYYQFTIYSDLSSGRKAPGEIVRLRLECFT